MTSALKKQPRDRPDQTKTETHKITELEAATETMAAYIGYLNTQIVNEENRDIPNLVKLKVLEAQKDQVLKERREMRPDNEELIAKSLFVYGPIMKALYS